MNNCDRKDDALLFVSSSTRHNRRHITQHDEEKISISRNIYIDIFCLRFALCFVVSLLHNHTRARARTHAFAFIYKLFKKFVSALLSSVSSSLAHSSFFFWIFSQVFFFVQNKMASFWHWKKKYIPFISFLNSPSLSTSSAIATVFVSRCLITNPFYFNLRLL